MVDLQSFHVPEPAYQMRKKMGFQLLNIKFKHKDDIVDHNAFEGEHKKNVVFHNLHRN